MKYWLMLGCLILSIFILRRDNSFQNKLNKHLRNIELIARESGIAGIDAVYCINLDLRTDKWNAVKQEIEDQGLHVNRVAAVNGWKDLTKTDCKKLLASEKALKPGQIGCFLSHLSVLKNAQMKGFERILVLEDDVSFIAPMKELSSYIDQLSETDPDWDLLYLDNWSMEDRGLKERFDRLDSTMSEVIKKPKEEFSHFFRVFYRHDLHALVVSKKGVQKLLDHFCKKPFLLAIDTEMNHIDQIRMYETKRVFVKTSYAVSDTWDKPATNKLLINQ